VNPLLRSALRHARRRPLGPLLVILGVALGVAVGIGIELANGAALRAMELSVERTAGRATHALSGAVQTPELWLARLRVELGQRAAAPVVEADVWLADRGGETLRLLGLDPWSEAPFRPYLAGAGTGAELDLGTFLTTPGAVLLGAPTAARLGLATGDRFELLVATTRRAVTLVGLLEPRDAFDRELLQGLLLCDVATAQELTGSEGFLSRIDLLLPAGEAGERRGAELLAAFGPGARLTPTAARVGTMERLTRSLRFNLQALSHLALVVGGFLVFSALSFAVVERREELGLLRTLGATRGQVALAIGIEGMLLVAAGTALGLGLGVVLGHGLVGLVLRTIDDLYFELEVSRALVSGGALGRGALLGLCTGAVAVAVPLLQALGLPPHRLRRRSDTEHGARRRQRLAARIGLVALLCGVAGGVAAERSMEWTALALLVGLLGAALLVPRAADLLLAAVEGPWARPLGGRAQLAARSARRSLSRTGVALSALTVALAASVGVAILVQSFRGTVEIWLARSLDGDVFLSGASVAGARTSGVVPAEWVERLRSTAGVAEVRLYRSATVQTDRGDLQVIGAQFGREHLERSLFRSGDAATAWPEFEAGRALVITEPLAFHRRLSPGDTVRFNTAQGPRELPVAAVIRDYASDSGVALLALPVLRSWFEVQDYNSAVFAAVPGVEAEELLARLRAELRPGETVQLRSNRELHAATLEVFDRTFAVTSVLRALILGVALVGLVSACAALGLDARRELATLRALGATPGQVQGLLAVQHGLLGLCAGLLAVPLGYALAYAMVEGLHARSFGWTLLAVDPSPAAVAGTVGLGGIAAVLAGFEGGRRAARVPLLEGLRDE
jgi:putative ABC transport system permease protein